MRVKFSDDSLTIISEDPMDAAYLCHLFGGSSIKCETDVTYPKDGFNESDEKEVTVTLSRVEE